MGKHENVDRWEKYSEDGDLNGKRCPRCSSLIAQHEDRETCGGCGFSKIQKG
ncbi:MAG: 30S ribosomal protein S27ae [Candidatus Nanohaloarchaea archaeon]|nr:30S ribosomal protein S27ae [Candidatus Nanohaloarchaea archaeon]